jgi:uncharacterized membrane protein YccC
MRPLIDFADKYPLSTGTLGVMSGLGSYLLSCLHAAAGVAADVGILLGCASSGLIVALLAHRWTHRNDRQDFRRPIHRYREPYPALDPDDELP